LWNRIGIYPHHGIDVFLPALRSKKSSGIGEFFDLLPLIDWCHELKMDVIQLLPLNDSDNDPSPYNPMSCCALNYLLLSLHALPHGEQLPTLPESPLTYEEVITHKTEWLQNYYNRVGNQILQSDAFRAFAAENASWLKPYALFKSIKERTANASWLTWPKTSYDQLLKDHASKITFHSMLQFLCYTQLKEVKEYARGKGILLKGDIPILVSFESAEVWYHPTYFNTDFAAGAPPDMYYSEGQYWGFPIFRWDVLAKDHYSWWKMRLAYASHFFDLFRIDHIIGFFRIWAIPRGATAMEGQYIPAEEEQWEIQGRRLLRMILSNSCGMMPIAEDLGTIPDVLPTCLEEMAICGTKVMRWVRYWEEEGQPYVPYTEYPPLSMTCVSTHDSPTLTQWWRDYPEEASLYAELKEWPYQSELTSEQRFQILWESHHTPSLFRINLLQEYLALFPELVWPNPNDERINIPGTVQPSNWSYRYLPSVEEIISHTGLKAAMQKILAV
jgi:4-alpha-glucanotransferase